MQLADLVITTSSVLVQTPDVIVQRNVLAPIDNPVTVLVGLDVLEKLPVPEITLHAPVPMEGVLPANTALPEPPHTDWSTPALEIVGETVTVVVAHEVLKLQGEGSSYLP